jgi:serine/threonine-protein kinase RsbW
MTIPAEFGIEENRLAEMILPSELTSIRYGQLAVEDQLTKHAYDPESTFAIKLALEEALANAVKHGNRLDPAKRVIFRYYVDAERAVFMVRDQGPGFKPEAVPDCTSEENLSNATGRGIMLMQAFMSAIHYNDRGNEVWMMKIRGDVPGE